MYHKLVKDDDLDLTQCDREPIHLIGRVQDFGCVLVLTSDWLVAFASENCATYLGANTEQLIGTPINELLNKESIHKCRSALQKSFVTEKPEYILGLSSIKSKAHLCGAVHFNGQHILLEVEEQDDSDSKDDDFVQSMLHQFKHIDNQAELYDQVAQSVRIYFEYDRVMLYRFGEDGSGQVVAEAKDEKLESLHGLRFPASDIPKQARALYLKSVLRTIADVEGKTHPLIPTNTAQAQHLDLGLAHCRAISPVHIQYLKNMQVRASFSISIIIKGELWGLIACHHYQAKVLSQKKRIHLNLFAELFSLELSKRIFHHQDLAFNAARRTYETLISAINTELPLIEAINELFPIIKRAIDFDGVACVVDDQLVEQGLCLSQQALKPVISALNQQASTDVSAFKSLNSLVPEQSFSDEKIAGLIAIPISKNPRDYILFFRKSETETVRWAGNPEKAVEQDGDSTKLVPRASFAEWVATHQGVCAPWSEQDIETAKMVRVVILEAVVRSLQEKRAQQQKSAEQKELLVSELNHRVRNILSLVSAIVAQTNAQPHTLESFVKVLSERIMSLSQAHDQVVQAYDRSVYLHNVLETEVKSYHGRFDSIRVQGPKVNIHSYAVTPIVLVLHELLTNSVKYGALSAESTDGNVSVEWHADSEGDLSISWVESGGPPVSVRHKEGFGMTIIRSVIPHELHGQANITFKTAGLEANFSIPHKFFSIETETIKQLAGSLQHTSTFKHADLSDQLSNMNCTVLIVEDSLLIALDIKKKLNSMGIQRTDIASSVHNARNKMRTLKPDLIIMDINLGNETTLSLAEDLLQTGNKILFITGYGAETERSEILAPVPVLIKPIDTEALSTILIEHQLIEAAH